MRSLLRLTCGESCCPLAHQTNAIPTELVRQKETQKLDILFVGEAPGRTEIDRDRPFIGVSGMLLRRAIRQARSRGELNVGFSNVVRCIPLDSSGEIRKPIETEVGCCERFILRDIEKTDPDVICLLGQTAINLLLPGRPTVHGERGRWHLVDVAGRQRIVCSTWHPAYVCRQKSALPMFFSDVQFFLRIAAGWRPRSEHSRLGTSICIKKVRGVEQLVERLLHNVTGPVALDVETRNLNKRYGNRLGMLQFCWDEDTAYCVPLDHPQTPFGPEELERVRELLRKLFCTKPAFSHWVTHFGKFEQTQIGQHVLDRRDGVCRTFTNAPMMDTGAFAYLLNENATVSKGSDYTLKRLARHYLGFFHYDDATLMARAEGNLFELPLDCRYPVGHSRWKPNLADYGGMDAYCTLRLFHALSEEATIQRYRKKALRLLEHLFGPTFALLSVIERNGFWGNLAHLKMLQDPERSPIVSRLLEIDNHVLPKIESAQRANERLVMKKSRGNPPIFGMPWVMDLNKNDHVRCWLVDEMQLEPLSVGKSGAPSVGKAFFQAYGDVEEVGLVEERRGLAKLQSSYIKQLIEYLDPRYRTEDCQDGRVRCDLFFTSTVSGRGSASNPNMQQQVRGDSPAKAAIKNIWQAEQPGVQQSFRVDFQKGPPVIRSAAQTPPTNCLVQLDYVTAEVKIWAILSRCPDLARALLKGYEMRQQYRADPRPELKDAAANEGDLHKNTASLMYGVAVSEVDKAMRTAVKSLTFGSMYGRGIRSIAVQLKKTDEEAEGLLNKFADAFPVGWAWLENCPERASRDWYIETPMGRRRRLIAYLLERDWEDMSWDERGQVREADRMAKNSPIQAFSSDVGFLGACLFQRYIEQNGLSWKIENVVHDSCVYQVPIAELRESMRIAEQCFTHDVMRLISDVWGVEWNCPLEIDFEFGLMWGGLQKWDFTDAEFDRIVHTMEAC